MDRYNSTNQSQVGTTKVFNGAAHADTELGNGKVAFDGDTYVPTREKGRLMAARRRKDNGTETSIGNRIRTVFL